MPDFERKNIYLDTESLNKIKKLLKKFPLELTSDSHVIRMAIECFYEEKMSELKKNNK